MALTAVRGLFMDHPEGAGLTRADRVDSDRRMRVEFRGAQISSNSGLLVMRELGDTLGLSDLAATALRETYAARSRSSGAMGCPGSRCSDGWLDTRMSTVPTGWS